MHEIFVKARTAAPCVLFFDDLDLLFRSDAALSHDDGGNRDRALSQILTEMEDMHSMNDWQQYRKGIFVIGATNRPDLLDTALLRSGRFDQLLYVSLPDISSRLVILQNTLLASPLAPDVDLASVAKMTHGFSGADLTKLCQRAAKMAIKASIVDHDDHSSMAHHDHKIQRFVIFCRPKLPV